MGSPMHVRLRRRRRQRRARRQRCGSKTTDASAVGGGRRHPEPRATAGPVGSGVARSGTGHLQSAWDVTDRDSRCNCRDGHTDHTVDWPRR